MPAVAVRRLAEDRADSADAHRPLIEHRRKIVLCGAGEDIAALDERKSSLVTPPPYGLHLGGAKLGVCRAAEAFG